tara:strand:+ start:1808 stop:3328 length:1521 start_codon:yes stop_codon:yes gene_type:complete
MMRFLFLLLLASMVWQCQRKDSTSESVSGTDIENGEALARQYCASCHLFPAPDLLDKATWTEKVLPNMAARLGFRTKGYHPFEGVDSTEISDLKRLNIYPEMSAISEETYRQIVTYYQRSALESLPAQRRESTIASKVSPFNIDLIKIGKKKVPQVTLLEYEPIQGILFIGDHLQLYGMDRNEKMIGSWQTQSPSVDIEITNEGIMVLSIGKFEPSEHKDGVFFPLTLRGNQPAENYVIPDLQRPVQFTIGDLNGDKLDDLVICSFGNHEGQLAWYDHFDQSSTSVLSTLPGARKAEIVDLNKDGKNDVVALITQAWEKLVVYNNTGDGQFEETTLISLPAVYGSSYFELADFNGDGHPDILMTNGDNWDYSNVPKPYHGVRIYLNDGENHFSESYFFPLYGCNEARAIDFDQDGDLDIAAIAFYSEQPTEGFVYLENDGQMNFTAYFINETACGKWLTMDIGDFNKDGYQDIFLGSYFHNTNELVKLMSAGIEVFPEVLLLTYKK